MSVSTEEITVRVDADAAKAYRKATPAERRKMDLLIGLQLQRFLDPQQSIEEIMQEASKQAKERGLTPEVLESILNEP